MTPSPRRVVVAVDNSRNARVALEHAVRRVGSDGELIVAHVVIAVPEALAGAMLVVDERRTVADQLVNQLVGAYTDGAEPVVLEGPIARRIAELAREREADEIVVGSRGLGRFSAALGSVAHALLQQADQPVVVVPAAAADYPREGRSHGRCVVIVGYDESEPSRAAMAYAARRSREGGRVVAVHAFQQWPTGWDPRTTSRRSTRTKHTVGSSLSRSKRSTRASSSSTPRCSRAPRHVPSSRQPTRVTRMRSWSVRAGSGRSAVYSGACHAVLHETDRVVVVIPRGCIAGGGRRLTSRHREMMLI